MVTQDRSIARSRLGNEFFFLPANRYGEARSKRQSRHHLQKLPGGTEVEGGRRATVSVTARLLLRDVANMKSK
jgi:hypothetical protein